MVRAESHREDGHNVGSVTAAEHKGQRQSIAGLGRTIPQWDQAMAGTRLDRKALRLAVHGWWLGNPLVYKPGAPDLNAIARELADTGAASGTLVLSDAQQDSRGDPHRPGDGDHGIVQAVLIVRPAVQGAPLGDAAALAIAEVVENALGRSCAVQSRWEVVLRDGSASIPPLCLVSVEECTGFLLVGLQFALARLRATGQNSDEPASALFERSDWREVFIARALHALDGRLHALLVA